MILVSAILFTECAFHNSRKDYVPQNGDLAFQISETSEFVKAITDASAQRDSLKFAHVGIIVVDNGENYVLEATPEGGVKLTDLTQYLSESEKIGGKPGVVIKRVTDRDFPIEEAVERAKSYMGQEYDWTFLPDNGKMYCSELVYESFIDGVGNHLFKASPMNFRDSNGDFPHYWTELFDRLGIEIPQGVSGTNPQDLSNETSLHEVYSFF
ncbi:MAG: hypothetical protein NC127_01040 [Muribaculum sp.]|nr:hypothetical protein [Muribaculum sp.]